MTQRPIDSTSLKSFDQSEERFRLLVEGVIDYAIFMLDPQGQVLTWNTGAKHIKGYEADEIIGQHFSKFYPPEALLRNFPEHELQVAGIEGRFEDEGWRVRKDGTRFWANVVITALRDDTGALRGFAKVTRDLTQRREHEEALRLSEERFRLLVEGVSDYAIFMLDPNGYVMTWNSGAERIKGYRADEIIGQHFSKFYPLDAIESGWPEHELQVATETGRFVEDGWRIRKDGTRFWANVTITAMRDGTGQLRGFAKLTRDLSERKLTERALNQSQRALDEAAAALEIARIDEEKARLRALHDAATGLPNRELFHDRLAHAISLADRHHWTLAVMFIDLDRFKVINDSHGHTIGDGVLKEISRRLRQHCRDEDTVCRYGGDEFLYLLMNPQGKDNIERIAGNLVTKIAKPIEIGALQLSLKASIGIALYPAHGATVEQLISNADMAMYRAKERMNDCVFFDSLGSNAVSGGPN